eukprot:Em0006g72a
MDVDAPTVRQATKSHTSPPQTKSLFKQFIAMVFQPLYSKLGQPNVSGNTATIPLHIPGWLLLLLVYNISTTRGTEVTVSLQGLTSGQMYYCKAAATNTNSNNCTGPVVGGSSEATLFYKDAPQVSPIAAAIGGVAGGVVCIIMATIAALALVFGTEHNPPAGVTPAFCKATGDAPAGSCDPLLNDMNSDVYACPLPINGDVKQKENYVRSADGLCEIATNTGHVYGLLQVPDVRGVANEYEDPQHAIKDNESGDLAYCLVEGKREQLKEPVPLDAYSVVEQKKSISIGAQVYLEVLPDTVNGQDL